MDIEDEELTGFWKTMHEFQVEYIMVGGFAVMFHGGTRHTEDVGLIIEENSKRYLRSTVILIISILTNWSLFQVGLHSILGRELNWIL